MNERLIGPTNIDCEQRCDVPSGMTLSEVPRPRHAWSDALPCPNCGRCFLKVPADLEVEHKGRIISELVDLPVR